MTGPEHYAEAERLLAVADRHTSGVTYGPEWTLTLTAAHVHATLALAAATAVGTAGPDRHAWDDIAATKYGSKPEPQAAVLQTPDPGSGALRRSSRQRTGRAIRSSRGLPRLLSVPLRSGCCRMRALRSRAHDGDTVSDLPEVDGY